MQEKLEDICKQEGVTCKSDVLEKLVSLSKGDMRRAVTCLQSCAPLHPEKCIMLDDIYEVMGFMEQLNEKVIFSENLSRMQKVALCEKLAICLMRLQDGADEYLQLMDACGTMMTVI
ncbi:hypothetical protein J437_LFUL013345 [Ladona fulva]|uniref:Replication factor C C-terminal domain-containing protein n=1 Tax=Ladona fulva TaxID=123851 RepID=A0A8K0P930_LADFU|nr:hypothetical protein J437_LFUL013345 [Ladona fulva]